MLQAMSKESDKSLLRICNETKEVLSVKPKSETKVGSLQHIRQCVYKVINWNKRKLEKLHWMKMLWRKIPQPCTNDGNIRASV